MFFRKTGPIYNIETCYHFAWIKGFEVLTRLKDMYRSIDMYLTSFKLRENFEPASKKMKVIPKRKTSTFSNIKLKILF